jgi:hypothetical protein
MKITCLFLLISLLPTTLILAACASSPEVIAAFPSSQGSYSFSSQSTYVVREAYLSMDVRYVDDAEEEIAGLARDQQGYMTGTSSYWADDRKFSSLSLEIPSSRYSDFRDGLDAIGNVTSEQLSTYTVNPPGYGYEEYTRVSINLSPEERLHVSLPDWRPLHTLQSAFNVFVDIFGVILDILIWIVVVAGPFVLIGWVLVKVAHRLAPRFRK